MKEIKTADGIIVLMLNPKYPVDELIFRALAQITSGYTQLTGIPTKDADMHTFGSDLSDEYFKFKAVPPTSTKQLVQILANDLCRAYNPNASFVQNAARELAISSGNVEAGVNMVLTCGFLLKGAAEFPPKTFGVMPMGNGEVWVFTKAVNYRAGYIRQWGPTKAIDVPPTEFMELIFGIETEFILTGLRRGGIYAMREASILPISRKPDSAPDGILVQAPVTKTKISASHKRIYSACDGVDTSNYDFGNWIYFVVL